MAHRGVLFSLFMIASSSSFGQSITVEVPLEVQQQGVTLLPADSQEASKYVAKIAGSDADGIKGLLPFSVVLVNGGQSRLLATLVGFRWTEVDDNRLTRTFGIQDFGGYPSQVRPGDGRLFVLQRGLNLYFARRMARPDLVEANGIDPWLDLVASTEDLVRSAKSMSAFIDSIVVEGVGLVGPDTRKMSTHGWDRKSIGK
jgi:hypothetical protein